MDPTSHQSFRLHLLKVLKDELLGPEPEDSSERQREELDVSPLQLYSAGVLFPRNTLGELREDEGADVCLADDADSSEDDRPEIKVVTGDTPATEATEPEEQPLNLANEFNPAAMGVTVRVDAGIMLRVEVSAGRYSSFEIEKPHPRAGQERADGQLYPPTQRVTQFRREPVRTKLLIPIGSAPGIREPIDVEGCNGHMKMHVRTQANLDHTMTVSVSLVNHRKVSAERSPPFDAAFFQVHIGLSDTAGSAVFHPIDRAAGAADHEEVESLNLLYREKRSFGLGHGCSTGWRRSLESTDRAVHVQSFHLPTHDLKPVRPREKPFLNGLFDLSMRTMSEAAPERVITQLSKLADDYEAWIESIEAETKTLDPMHWPAAGRHITKCRICLARTREGISRLESDADVMLAFRLANHAMLVQQVRTHLRDRDPNDVFEELPPDHRIEEGREPVWRPFQIAFVLINIACCSDDDHRDRELVDLIWFPTGGGKTEAYLGLAAYCICLKRLLDHDSRGTTVLMRYTLRLLTAQQFQRATALISALEVMRQERTFGTDLGEEPITIGLWVGMGLSPNRRKDGLYQLNEIRGGSGTRNPFQLLRCPWCRTAMDRRGELGYDNEPFVPGSADTVVFRCPNAGCRWHSYDQRLPVLVIDDDIFDRPPTLLIGTVDKFAQLSWEPRTRRLFGVNEDWSPPSLIIQDELHLISGPLGTIVGLYETAIDELCRSKGGVAKIVASTATIRESAAQCQALFARRCFEFPPQGLSAGDSYFAYEDSDAAGRLYVGVFGSAVKSHATAQVRVLAPLLQAVMPHTHGVEYDENIADGYATVLWYFNSLRELGHAVTMCTGDVPEHHFNICRRLDIDKSGRRFIRRVEELTSRRTADEIPKILDDLSLSWTPRPGKASPVDILLATNMISVGVDVPRLGLMVVTGQPKTTTEYIQATSRVGRSFPGLVITVYNPARSRDRSHYEQFTAYHQALYRYVEPTSVTPFSPPARSRGFAGLLIALARLLKNVGHPGLIADVEPDIREIARLIVKRVSSIDPSEVRDAEQELNQIIAQWKATAPTEYGHMAGSPGTRTLMYPYGRTPTEGLEDEAFPVLTSMRNVDTTCGARVLSKYPATRHEP